ncbi:hypothetical protein D3C77_446290 [compost metagenome]
MRIPRLPTQARRQVAQAVYVQIALGIVFGNQRQTHTEGQVVPNAIIERKRVGEGVLGLALTDHAIDRVAHIVIGAKGLDHRIPGQGVVKAVCQRTLPFFQQGIALFRRLKNLLQRLGAIRVIFLFAQRRTRLIDIRFDRPHCSGTG